MKWVKCGYVPPWASRNWRVIRPISVRTYKLEGFWYADSRWLGLWGCGMKSRTEAMEDFMALVFELTELLEGQPLGKQLQRQFVRMATYIERRQNSRSGSEAR